MKPKLGHNQKNPLRDSLPNYQESSLGLILVLSLINVGDTSSKVTTISASLNTMSKVQANLLLNSSGGGYEITYSVDTETTVLSYRRGLYNLQHNTKMFIWVSRNRTPRLVQVRHEPAFPPSSSAQLWLLLFLFVLQGFWARVVVADCGYGWVSRWRYRGRLICVVVWGCCRWLTG